MPDLRGYQLAQVTVRHLLTHTAGVPLRANLRNLYGTDPDQIRTGVLCEPLHRPPGEAVEYTDRAALILGFLAEHLRFPPNTSSTVRPPSMTSPSAGISRAPPMTFPPGCSAASAESPEPFHCGRPRDVPAARHRTPAPEAGSARPGSTSRSRSTPVTCFRRGACSGTPPPAPTLRTAFTCTTASPEPACGPHPNKAAGPSCSPTSFTTAATAKHSSRFATPSALRHLSEAL